MRRHGHRRTWAPWRRMLLRLLGILLVAVLAAVARVQRAGLPRWAIARAARRLATAEVVFDADRVTFDGWGRAVVEGARAYRKRVVGPPMAEAARVIVEFDAQRLARRQPAVRQVTVCGGIARPEAARGPSTSGRPGHAVRPVAMGLMLRNCTMDGVRIEDLTCDLRVAGTTAGFENVLAVLHRAGRRGAVRGAAAYDWRSRRLTGRCVTRLDPELVQPWLDALDLRATARFLRRFAFAGDPPRTEAAFAADLRPGGDFEWRGQCSMDDLTYRGVGVIHADGGVTVERTRECQTIRIAPLLVVREEGIGRGSLTVDMRGDLVRFEGQSTIHPRALAGMIGILTNGVLDAFTFAGPVSVRADGVASYDTLQRCDFKVDVAGAALGRGSITAETFAASMRMVGTTNNIRTFTAGVCGGTVTGNAEVVFSPGAPAGYSLRMKVLDAQCAALASSVMDRSHDYRGRLSARLDITGRAGPDAAQTVCGRGTVWINDGRVFSMPLFGGLSDFMKKIVPGLDFVLRQTDASADFTLSNGKAHSDAVRVEGDVLSLTARGDYYLDGRLDFQAQVQLMKENTLVAKLLRLLTYPITKLLEFRVRGTRADPVWYPINFSREVLRGIGSTPPE